MDGISILIWIAVIVAVIVIIAQFIKIYNNLVGKDTDIQIQEGEIDATLQKRDDLVKQLSTLTKRAAIFEKDTQTGSARERNSGKQGNILATSERYPELKAIGANFSFFQEQIAELENSLRAERSEYNALVGDYRVYVRTFPIFLVASPLGYKTDRYEMFSTEIKNKPEFWSEK